jgi:hypothetical protein
MTWATSVPARFWKKNNCPHRRKIENLKQTDRTVGPSQTTTPSLRGRFVLQQLKHCSSKANITTGYSSPLDSYRVVVSFIFVATTSFWFVVVVSEHRDDG